MLGVVALMLVQAWLLDGLVPWIEIDGGSMAPSFSGPRVAMQCPTCGHRFDCDADAVPQGVVVCANCGQLARQLPGSSPRRGGCVLVDRTALAFRPPKRWEPIVFRHPVTSEWTVKRVAGLPGERIEIREGEVFVDGRLAVKPLATLRAMATLVSDTNCTAILAPGSRWVATEPAWLPLTASARAMLGYSPTPNPQPPTPNPQPPTPNPHPPTPNPLPAASGEAMLWYGFRAGGSNPAALRTPPPITTCGGYNGTISRRPESIACVGDLLLEIDLPSKCEQARLAVVAKRKGERYVLYGDLGSGQWRVDDASGRSPGTWSLGKGKRLGRLSVALADGRYLAALDGRVVAGKSFRGAVSPAGVDWNEPFAVGLVGVNVEKLRVRVYRDVFYTTPEGLGPRRSCGRPASIGEGGYFVLGDNSVVSEDSRNWAAPAGVQEDWLVGRPWLVGERPTPPR